MVRVTEEIDDNLILLETFPMMTFARLQFRPTCWNTLRMVALLTYPVCTYYTLSLTRSLKTLLNLDDSSRPTSQC